MEYTTLGKTGLQVSKLCLGGLSFGGNREWALNEEQSRDIIEYAIDLGINFFDTSNAYGAGESERIYGEVLNDYDRDRMIMATKGYYQVDPDNRNSGGLSKKAIERNLDASLQRLNMDSVDIYQIHKWDYRTPVETTLRSLTEMVRRGKSKYIGATSLWAHQLAEAINHSDRLNIEKFTTMQSHYNLAYREEEREMFPYCKKKGLGVISWSPLARGYLTRPHKSIEDTIRGQSDDRLDKHPYQEGGGLEINRRVEEVASEKGVTMAQIALAWVANKQWVDCLIVGTTSIQHLEEAVEALEIHLSDSQIEYLEEPYQPVRVSGHNGRPPDRHIRKDEI
jgi:aryl-alcohol dehydrogenase-like predicted oxidoreductase